jgi:hypothetical protein
LAVLQDDEAQEVSRNLDLFEHTFINDVRLTNSCEAIAAKHIDLAAALISTEKEERPAEEEDKTKWGSAFARLSIPQKGAVQERAEAEGEDRRRDEGTTKG